VPLYEYECAKCRHRFEKIERVTASAVKTCPVCGGKAERLLAAPAIQFKGSGWYVTDYAKKAASSGKEKEKSDGQPSPSEAAKSKEAPAKKEKEKTSKP
jgi:putative FmdB family regulatory protein